jgi:putative ABC transport system permease protein
VSRRPDIEDEIRFHLESRVRDLMEEGLSRSDAEALAQREFGDRASVGQACRSIRRQAEQRRERRHYWAGWRNDFRYGLRAILRAPFVSLSAITILAIGIGLSSTVFAVVHAVFLNPLPYPHARELQRVFAVNAEKDNYQSPMSAGDFFALRAALAPDVSVGAYMTWPVSLTGVDAPERLTGALASADLFKTLGVAAAEGRTFSEDDEDPSRNVAIISTRLASRLGLLGHAAGATIEFGRTPTLILGVMPPTFHFPDADTDVWIPLGLRPADRNNHASRYLHTVARVPPDLSGQARDRLITIMGGLETQFPASNAGWSARTEPLHDVIVGSARSTLVLLTLSIACLLLVMAVNLAMLLTSRLRRRAAELSVHQALGADRWRLLRQVGSECLMMTVAGGALGLMLASGLTGLFQRLAHPSVPRADEVAISAWIIVFAIAAAALGLMAMTLLPLWTSLRVPGAPLSPAARGTAGARRPSRALVVAQSAMACVLMVAAALLAQTYVRLSNAHLGFRPDSILTLRIALPFRTPLPQQAAYFTAAVDRVREVPGVIAAGAVSDLPLSGNSLNVPVRVDGSAIASNPDDEIRASFRVVTPGYLETIGARVSGRAFDGGDAAGRPLVALVNEAFASRHWPGRNPIGLRVSTSEDPDWRTVVGIVGNIHHDGARGEEGPAIYVPHAQKSEAFLTWMSLAIRAASDPVALAPPVRAALTTIDRYQPVSDVAPLSASVSRALALPRLAATVAGVVALGTMVLAVIGIGAVLSLLVSARTADFAVRLALGAPPSRLKWTPLIECLTLVGGGAVAGLVAAALLTRLMRSLLFGVAPTDIPTFALSALMLLAVAALTALGPARAIARIDPALTLRG